MKRLASIMPILAFVLALPAPAAATELRTIPARFHGHWAMTVEQCTPKPQDDANIRIGARFIIDYATRMAVRSVSVQGYDKDRDMIIASGRISTGTAHYNNATRLELFDNGTMLGQGEGEDHAIYVRCKK